uniref:Uncharacterized protein n=1 Tax=Melopsittacus undulatus TaxID=13146 RepID=A0A8C6J1T3_MELUD
MLGRTGCSRNLHHQSLPQTLSSSQPHLPAPEPGCRSPGFAGSKAGTALIETGKNCKTKHESSRARELQPTVSLGMVFPVLPLRFLDCCLPLCLPFLTGF